MEVIGFHDIRLVFPGNDEQDPVFVGEADREDAMYEEGFWILCGNEDGLEVDVQGPFSTRKNAEQKCK